MIKFERVKYQNFYVAELDNGIALLKSYNTIVGLLDRHDNICFDVKYSQTTSKQVTQYVGSVRERIRVSSETLHNIILNRASLDLNTRYNGISNNYILFA